jgi:Tol biopolymer transport system component
MYFASDRVTAHNHSRNFDIYYSEWDLNNFKTPVKLESSVNTSSYEADVFVAPDESYLIFCSTRPSGLGRGDLYISFNEGG